ncbi:MAG TPA: cytochrome c3 family protein [Bacteroidota bacterium]|nr:cytochrome c3 family protein [Bacteroidota bacterium]
MRNKILVFGACLFAAIIIVFARSWSADDGVKAADKAQVIKFSHQKHITEVGIDCATCHNEAAASQSSSDKLVPGHAVCQTCHEDEVKSTCGYCHVDAKNPVPFPREARELRFNHKMHVTDGKMQCVTCHTGLDKVDYATAANMPAMATCTTCHNNTKVTNQCETCHTNLATLRPASHNEGNFLKNHSAQARLNAMGSQCSMCHTENYCAQCHDGSNLTALSPKEKIGMISPRTMGDDKSQALKGQAVHDINYRFTHGIDAKGHAADCQVCHHEQAFCNDCHQNGSEALGGVIPISHEAAGFVTIGVGTGGGEHARLARRDIESCMSCHDVEGSDPTCMKCHVDPDGIKGTNPKTHPIGFMSGNSDGDWHTNAGSTCFACHTDPNAKPIALGGVAGIGFCGYCHGKK